MATPGLCHACPHFADGLSGKWKDTPFYKTPCAKCVEKYGDRAVESLAQGHGRCASYNDALGGGLADDFIEQATEAVEGRDERERARELVRDFVFGIIGTSKLQRRVLKFMFDGLPQATIAAKTKRSRQCIAGVVRRLERRCFWRLERKQPQ